MHAAAEILQICRIGGNGAGLLGIGPGLLVGVLARLLIRPLLLLLLLCLLRIRGLAAGGREGSRGNNCNDRQFRKCGAPSAPGLLIQISAHAWPFPGLCLHPRRGQAIVTKSPAQRLFPRPPQLWRPKCWGRTELFLAAIVEEPIGKDFAEIALI